MDVPSDITQARRALRLLASLWKRYVIGAETSVTLTFDNSRYSIGDMQSQAGSRFVCLVVDLVRHTSTRRRL